MLLRALAELIAPSTCAACDEPVGSNTLFCPTCARTVERASGDAAFVYGGAVAEAIQRFKFGQRPDRIARFAPLLVPLVPGDVDLVRPVPIHPARLIQRGYNQSALLARPVARACALPTLMRGLERVRDTPMQSTLDRAARLSNLERAFVARDFTTLRGRAVLLVDDVRTTGSTLRACADALHEVGVRRVFPLVLACSDGSAL